MNTMRTGISSPEKGLTPNLKQIKMQRIGRPVITSLFLLLISACQNDPQTWEAHFGIQDYEMKEYDLYNLVSNSFRLDPQTRTKYADHSAYKAYYEADSLRYLFYTTESYGYVGKFVYCQDGRLDKTILYPVLGASIHDGAKPLIINYFYEEDSLIAIRDDLNDKLFFVQDDTVIVYQGILGPESRYIKEKLSVDGLYGPLLD